MLSGTSISICGTLLTISLTAIQATRKFCNRKLMMRIDNNSLVILNHMRSRLILSCENNFSTLLVAQKRNHHRHHHWYHHHHHHCRNSRQQKNYSHKHLESSFSAVSSAVAPLVSVIDSSSASPDSSLSQSRLLPEAKRATESVRIKPGWTCPTCTYRHDEAATVALDKCVMCASLRPIKWRCTRCSVINDSNHPPEMRKERLVQDLGRCAVCYTVNPNVPITQSNSDRSWHCLFCRTYNTLDASVCFKCYRKVYFAPPLPSSSCSSLVNSLHSSSSPSISSPPERRRGGLRKLEPLPVPAPLTPTKQVDVTWCCDHCQNANFMTSSFCARCKTPVRLPLSFVSNGKIQHTADAKNEIDGNNEDYDVLAKKGKTETSMTTTFAKQPQPHPQPLSRPSVLSSTSPSSFDVPKARDWECAYCSWRNFRRGVNNCEFCLRKRITTDAVLLCNDANKRDDICEAETKEDEKKENGDQEWACVCCTFLNKYVTDAPNDSLLCAMCGAKGVTSFGATSQTTSH